MVPLTDPYKNESQNFLEMLLYFMQMGNHPSPSSNPFFLHLTWTQVHIQGQVESGPTLSWYLPQQGSPDAQREKGKGRLVLMIYFLTGFMDAMNLLPYPIQMLYDFCILTPQTPTVSLSL